MRTCALGDGFVRVVSLVSRKPHSVGLPSLLCRVLACAEKVLGGAVILPQWDCGILLCCASGRVCGVGVMLHDAILLLHAVTVIPARLAEDAN